jgi:hypothetical protein
MGTATKITMLAVFGHNLTSVATVTLQANATDSWGAPSFSMALTWHARCIAAFINQTYRWWRITIEDGSNPAGYVEIGRVCAGEYYEPGVNVNQEIVKKLVDPSYKQESEGRQGYAIEKEPYRTIEVYFSGIDRTQQNELETMFRAVRRTRPLVFALDPDNYPGEDTIYCEMTSDLSEALAALGYGDVTLNFEEKVT